MLSQLFLFYKIWNTQWLPEEKLRAYQNKALTNLIEHAYSSVPYYKKLFNETGILPNDIKCLEDLYKIPITTKEMIRNAGSNLLSKKFQLKDLTHQTTGGSTGEALTIYRDLHSLNLGRSAKLRTFVANGYKINWKIAELHGFTLKSRKKFYHNLGLHKTVDVPAQLTHDVQLKILKKLNPECMDCFPNRLEDLNNYLADKNIGFNPKIIFTNSETLSEKVRKSTQERFNISPIDIYGSTEFQFAAWECNKHEGYHINSDQVYFEISTAEKYLSDDPSGDIIGTDLTNYAMPLIRYKTGDIGSLKKDKCSCGRTLPMLKEIKGRENQFLVLPSGRKISGTQYIDAVLISNKNIRQYYAHQKRDKSLSIFLSGKNGAEINRDEILQKIKTDCEGIKVEIINTKNISKTEAGKYLLFTSEAE